MVKTRTFPENNYKAFWFNGKTIRMTIDSKIPISELEYPEFYDVKITNHCLGDCPWCYMSSSKTGQHYKNVVGKINNFFGKMSKNQRPFQVAIGGGEPTIHPEFVDILEAFYDLGIEPNYTTNGMYITPQILAATKELCGGVAVSCHQHLVNYWLRAITNYTDNQIKLNLHIIISDKESIDYFTQIYNYLGKLIDYFVLLPYTAQGRAMKKDINWDYLMKAIPKNTNKIAFGAGFYPYLLRRDHDIKVSLYEPEIMSKFLDMKDMKIYPSSFNLISRKD